MIPRQTRRQAEFQQAEHLVNSRPALGDSRTLDTATPLTLAEVTPEAVPGGHGAESRGGNCPQITCELRRNESEDLIAPAEKE